jgi:hypothetical protein
VSWDVRLGHEIAGDVAGKLIARDIPFVVCSGYDLTLQGLNIPVVRKPYTTDALAQALGTAMSSVRKPGSSAPIR